MNQQRITCNITAETVATLRRRRLEGQSATESVRRAVALLHLVDSSDSDLIAVPAGAVSNLNQEDTNDH